MDLLKHTGTQAELHVVDPILHVAKVSRVDAIAGLGVRRIDHDVFTRKQRLVYPLEKGLCGVFRQGRVGPIVAGSDVAQLVLREKLVLLQSRVLHLNVHSDCLQLVILSMVQRIVFWNRLQKLIQQAEPRFIAVLIDTRGICAIDEEFEVILEVELIEVSYMPSDVDQFRI